MAAEVSAGEIAVTMKMIDELTPALAQMKEKLGTFQKQTEGMGGAATEAGKNVEALGGISVKAGLLFAGLGTAAGFVGLQLLESAKQAVAYSQAMEKLSAQTGIGVGALANLEKLGVTTGVSIETLARAVLRMNQNLDSPAAQRALKDLNINFADLRAMKPEDQFLTLATSVASIKDPIERMNAGVAIFGRTWEQIAPAVQGDVQKVIDTTKQLSKEQIDALARWGDAWDHFQHNAHTSIWAFFADLELARERQAQAADEFGKNTRLAVANPFNVPAIDAQALAGVRGRTIPGVNTFNSVTDVTVPLNGETLAQQIERNKQLQEDLRKDAQEAKNFAEAVASIDGKTIQLNADLLLLGTHLRTIGNGMAAVAPSLGILSGSFSFPQGLQSIGGGPGGVAAAARENISETKTPSTFDALISNVPTAIVGAIQGGGSKLQAAGSAIGSALFGKDSKIFKMATEGAAGIGGAVGSMISKVAGMIPVFGSLLGPAVAGLAKLFGKSEESAKVSPLRDAFFKAAGGLDVLNPKVEQLTGSLDLVDAIFKAKTVDDYNAAIQNLSDTLKFADDAMNTLMDTAKKYGITLEELGPALQKQELDKQAQQLFQDWQVLAAGGIDLAVVAGHMADSINAFQQAAIRTGQDVPAAMKPMLEKMAEMGLLTDDAGNVITDLEKSGIHFAETMSEGFTRVVDAVKKLTDVIAHQLGFAIESIPDADFDVRGHVKLPDNFPQDFPFPPVIQEAAGGRGHATGPALFYTKGNEDWAFSGEGKGFGAASGGAMAVTVNVDASGSLFTDRQGQRELADAVITALSQDNRLFNTVGRR